MKIDVFQMEEFVFLIAWINLNILENLNALLPKCSVFEPFLDEYLNKLKN